MSQSLFMDLEKNTEHLNSMFSNSADLYSKELFLFNIKCRLFMFEGLSSIEKIYFSVSSSLHTNEAKINSGQDLLQYIKTYTDLPVESNSPDTFDQLSHFLTSGASILIIDGCCRALVFSSQKMQFRSVQEPSGEGDIRGPREGFSEILRVNISMIRRLMRTEGLVVKTYTLGEKTQTEAAIFYDSRFASETLVAEIEKKLKIIHIPVLFDPGYLSSFLHKGAFSFFRDTGSTERPATACAKLCEGKIIIMVNGSPFALIVPYFFNENFECLDDYASKAYFASFIRVIKYIAFFLSVLLPGIFVSVACYTPEMLPPQLLYSLIKEDQLTPLPLFMEMILAIILLEIIREAGLRLPKPIGHTVSLVAALIVGDTAVKAGILSTPIIITAALTTVSMLCISSLYEPSTILRLLFVLFAGLFGPAGVAFLFFVMLMSIGGMHTFGIPYSSPFAPFGMSAFRDGIIRLPWPKLSRKAFSINQLPGGNHIESEE